MDFITHPRGKIAGRLSGVSDENPGLGRSEREILIIGSICLTSALA